MTDQPTVAALGNLLKNMEPDTVPASVDSGNPEMLFNELIKSDQFESGVWRCSPGGWTIKSFSVNEVMHILKGRLRLTDTTGKVTEVGAGELLYLPKGWAGRWDTLEELEKIYFIIY